MSDRLHKLVDDYFREHSHVPVYYAVEIRRHYYTGEKEFMRSNPMPSVSEVGQKHILNWWKAAEDYGINKATAYAERILAEHDKKKGE